MSANLSKTQAQRIASVLREFWGFDSLRPLQEQAISAALAHRDSLLVMPTGGGKSLCYQVPPLVDGYVDIVVSPLISLMKDQVDGLKEAGVPARALHSALTASERREIHQRIAAGELRLLFTSPERLLMDGFLDMLKGQKVCRFAIDEAHCISQWGHDFRPEYRQLATLRQHIPGCTLHAFTATATPRVRQDIAEQLQLNDPLVLVGDVDRANLVYRILPKVDAERQTLEVLSRHVDEAAIVYCISRKETESLAKWLTEHKVVAKAYNAGMDAADRHRIQEDFANEKLDVVVATVAFGMGIDRSNVRCVIHTGMPKSIEHYQQETGRAGRDGLEAECVLLYSAGDAIKWERIITQSAGEAADPGQWLRASMDLIHGMSHFASAPLCRHRALSEYFGQTYPKATCEACDVCLDEVDAVPDSTVLAQKIISCVVRAQQRFGVGQIVDILSGAQTENIRRYRHGELSTYGLLKELDKKQITALVYQLVDQKLLAREEGDYPILKLNAASVEILKGQREVKLAKVAAKAGKRTARGETDLQGVDAGLAAVLRKWRRDLALARGVPPYVIFPDTTLNALARIRPTNQRSLRLVSGVGERKAGQFGDALCREIAAYCRDRSLQSDVIANAPEPARPTRPAPVRPARESKSQVLDRVYDLFREGRTVPDVAATIDRALSTTCQYLVQFIYDTKPANVDPWVPPQVYKRVQREVAKASDFRLTPIFEAMNQEVPYEVIRIVLAHMKATGQLAGSVAESE